MGPIVCATRGGEAGRRTQEWAIALAKEREAELIFLCVFDASFAEHLSGPLAAAVEEEQQWLGQGLLGIAQVRARQEKVEAGAVVRSGPVLETIEAFLRQVGASTLVIGESRNPSSLATFRPGRVSDFAQRIRQDTGIEVIIVTPDNVLVGRDAAAAREGIQPVGHSAETG
jgi:nucleotide-binding universal stress UspA family protein